MQTFLARHALIVRGFFLFAFVAAGFLTFSTNAYAFECDGDVGCMFVDAITSFMGKIIATIFFFAVQLFGVLLGWISAFFNTAALVTVFQFSNYFGNSDGLLIAWGILRDLANIVLLFGFVFIGIATILGIQNYTAKTTLPRLIVVAVLLNFSLFVTEAVIDTSNAIGSSFFSQAGGVNCGFQANFEQCAGQGIGGEVMKMVGITSILSPESWAGLGAIMETGDGIAAAVLYLGILILVITMCGIMFAGAIILVVRAVTLMLVMVTSPIGFAAMAIPGFDKVGGQWRKALLDNAIFAPVFVLLVLVGLKISEGARNSLVGANFSFVDVLAGGDPAKLGTVFVMFSLIIGFFWGALIFAKKSGVVGADMVSKGAMKWVGNTAGAFTLYPAAAAASGVGKVYNAGARGLNRGVNRLSAAMPQWLKTTANIASLGGTYAAVKGIRGAGAAIDRGIAGTIGSVGGLTIPGTGMDSYNKVRELTEKRAKEMEEGDSAEKKKIRLDAALNQKNDDDVKAAVSSMSVAQLKEGGYLDDSSKSRRIAHTLSASKFAELAKDTSVSGAIRDRMKQERYSELQKKIDKHLAEGNKEELEKFMKDKDVLDLRELRQFKEDGDLATVDARRRMTLAMSPEKFKQFVDDKDTDSVIRKRVRTAREEANLKEANRVAAAALAGNRDEVERFARETEVADLAAMRAFAENNPADVAVREQIARVMPDQKFKRFMEDTNVSNAVKERLAQARHSELEANIVAALDPSLSPAETAAAQEKVAKWSIYDFESSGILTDPGRRAWAMQAVSDEQHRKLQSSGELGSTTKEELENLRNGTIVGSRFADAATTSRTLRQMSRRRVAELPSATLATPHVREQLKPDQLLEIARADSLNSTDKASVSAYLRSLPATNRLKRNLQIYVAGLGGSDQSRMRSYYGL